MPDCAFSIRESKDDDEVRKQSDELRSRLAEVEERLSVIQRRLVEEQAEKLRLASDLTTATNELKDAHTNLEQSTAVATNLRAELADLHSLTASNKRKYESELADRDEKLRKLVHGINGMMHIGFKVLEPSVIWSPGQVRFLEDYCRQS
jgi:predicted  nucleic acid-binding Zn-ribbon protein